MKSLCIRFVPVAVLLAPLVAAAHPGHDDPDITWDLDHLVEHPVTTVICFSVIGAGAWLAWRLAKRERVQRKNQRP